MRSMMRPRSPRDLDAPARRTRGLAEENIGGSATPVPRVEGARALLVVPNVDYGRAHNRFARLVGQFALAISTAAVTTFLVFWTLAIEWRHGPSGRTADAHSTEPRLIGPTQAPETAAAQTTGVAASVGTDRTAPRETPNSQATSAPLRRLDREEIAHLLKRGEELVAAGQLGPARLVLRRAAEAGDSDAAFALAMTYDPILLRARVVIGVAPDDAMARAWYEKAKELGSMDASKRLEAIGPSRKD